MQLLSLQKNVLKYCDIISKVYQQCVVIMGLPQSNLNTDCHFKLLQLSFVLFNFSPCFLACTFKKKGASVPFLPCWFHSFFDYPAWQVFFYPSFIFFDLYLLISSRGDMLAVFSQFEIWILD